jgi:alpha-galactosidase
MGYSSWMDTSSNVTEDRIKYIADLLVSTGLSKLGYVYVNVDEGWLQGRDSNGSMVYDPVKFPSGMKALGDYIHSLGLKYGLYTCRGTCQCSTSEYQGPGSQGYEKQDADLMVSWGMDYLKEDSCCASQDHDTAFQQYGLMSDALNATGRPVFFSLCGWNSWYAPVGYTLGNSWRIAGDGDNWPALTNCINVISTVYNYSRPGGWNDPDLLIANGAGSYGPDRGGWYQTDLQARSQFSMWCIFPAPLLISADIGGVSQYTMETWSNAEAIAINQDLGRYPDFPHGAWRLVGDDLNATAGTNVWGRALSDGGFAVAFLNNFPNPQNITCDESCFSQMNYPSTTTLSVRDLWAHQNIDTISPTALTAMNVPGKGGVAFYRLSVVS